MIKVIKMTLERETKGAIRYQEVDDNGNVLELANVVIGTLYVRKSANYNTNHDKLTITIRSGEDLT